VLQRGDRGGDPVVGEVRRHRHQRQADEARRVLGDVEGAAAADPDDGVVRPRAEPVDEPERGLDGPARDVVDAGVLELGPDGGDDLLPEARTDDDGDVALGGDATVAEKRRERRHRAAADLDRQRAGDHAR
jgi:hypothetical protein